MTDGNATLRIISGVDGKSPACFLVEAEGRRIMLDLGYGPPVGMYPDVDDVGKVDALIIGHSHKDHAGSLHLREKIGNPPIYAGAIVAGRIDTGETINILPLKGVGEVLGIAIETGRTGHAPGGLWLNLKVGKGLLYMSDHTVDSIVYDWDQATPAHTVLLDGSYGDSDEPMADQQRDILAIAKRGGLLLPVPADGRGPEIALYLMREGVTNLRMDAPMRASVKRLIEIDSDTLRPGVREELQELEKLALPVDDDPTAVTVACPAAAGSGETARLAALWEKETMPAIVFNGFVPENTTADRLVKAGRAVYRCWNVHPRLSENAELVRVTGAKVVVPCFGETAPYMEAFRKAFAPAEVTIDRVLTL
ncbi:MAG: MBL fold metallo-hydrolase [Methylobacteriaceae bacterium]|jgi:Cft2 family RNA processing exonuclease|nr:MBL fold metallo-hydrolase [Methylobacteriaceae bacterium]